jgi:hypothetical protein
LDADYYATSITSGHRRNDPPKMGKHAGDPLGTFGYSRDEIDARLAQAAVA